MILYHRALREAAEALQGISRQYDSRQAQLVEEVRFHILYWTTSHKINQRDAFAWEGLISLIQHVQIHSWMTMADWM